MPFRYSLDTVFLWYNLIEVIFMETKVCNKCGLEKKIDEFELRTDTHKRRNTCLECRRAYCRQWHSDNKEHVKKYREDNREYIQERSKEYYKNHRDKLIDYSREFRNNNPDYVSEYNKKYNKTHKEERKKYNKQYNIDNKEQILEYKKQYHQEHKEYENEYAKKMHAFKKVTDKKYVLRVRMRNLIKHSFERQGYSKKSHTYEIIGTDYDTFYNHLLQTFLKNYGYEWDGKEEVHIDHIIPLSTANSEEEIIALCNYKNLQLLKAKDNLDKSNKIDWEISNKE